MKENRELPAHEMIPQIVSEIVDMEHEAVAIACIMVRKDGNISTKMAYNEGTKLLLLAGLEVFSHDMKTMIVNQK